VESWNANKKRSNTQPPPILVPLKIPVVATQAVTMEPGVTKAINLGRKTAPRLSATKQPPVHDDTQRASIHFLRRSSRTASSRISTNQSISKRDQIPSSVSRNSKKRNKSQFPGGMPPSSTDDWFEVREILDQRGRSKVKVSWAGINPSTGQPWPSTWVYLPIHETHFGRSGERIARQLFSMLGKRNKLVRNKRTPQFLFK